MEPTKAPLILTVLLVASFLTACVSGSDDVATVGHKTPTPILASSEGPEATLKRFMLARIHREDQVVLELLSDVLRSGIGAGATYGLVFQASNPCWYRYEVAAFARPTSTTVKAQGRVYEHWWGGDNAGGLPTSWEQELGLVKTPAGWRVDHVGSLENRREEPKEPHGPTLSACNVARRPKT